MFYENRATQRSPHISLHEHENLIVAASRRDQVTGLSPVPLAFTPYPDVYTGAKGDFSFYDSRGRRLTWVAHVKTAIHWESYKFFAKKELQ